MRTSYSKKHKAAISVLSGLTAALLLLTGCSKSEETVYQIPEDRKLIVYTAHKADVYEPIIKEFEERTGIFVELKAGDTLKGIWTILGCVSSVLRDPWYPPLSTVQSHRSSPWLP